ncbi:unnamed protein product [Macrosiphum euphorbiae]|uniref:DDE-1 domain-containing protein n=1 Tax=Macrosiphum euphorbiae TaxID=13131 RepID=A0AAV0WEI7_9HEMI|nr:unnamed protein product [Macrosiphum euphorbiae]
MPRNRVKTKNRCTTSESTMQKGALLCLDNLMSEQSAATAFNICHVSCLNRYIEKFKRHKGTSSCLPAFGYGQHNKIFDDFQEKQLADYVQISADMYFGFNSKNIGKLAYEFSVKLDLTVPYSWKQNKVAGPDWITDFLKRNPSLFICLPKATGISRAINFNPENLKHFMDKYESILLKYKIQAHDIYNMDEIGVTFVQKTGKIVAFRGNKHNKAITSGKNSTVTMYLAINGAGNLIPPMHIYSKAANNLNFMQGVEFLKILKKFRKYVRPSVDKKVLILLDNHESNLCLPVIDFCKKSGILLLSFPPHGFHNLQPLNRSVYRPFNKCLNQNISAWIENNPGIKLRTYDVPLVSSSTSAFVSAATPQNVINGFSMTGIWPINRDTFTEDTYFMPAVFDDMSIDNVDEEPINDVIREPKNTITEEPANINIIPRLKAEETFTSSFLFSDLDKDSREDPLCGRETLNLSIKLSEPNNPGIKFKDSNNLLIDIVDIEKKNYLISLELKNAINHGPANVDIFPHLKIEESSTPSFVFSDPDKHFQEESSFNQKTLELIKELTERHSKRMKSEDSDKMLIDNVDEEPINDVIREPKNTITEEPAANVDIIPHLKREESSTPSFVFSVLDKDSRKVPSFNRENLELIKELTERNNKRMKFEDGDKMLIDNVDKEPINDVIREPKNTITEEPAANVDIIPHLKREESSTPSFVFSDLDKDSREEPSFNRENFELIKELTERNNKRMKFEDSDNMLIDIVDIENINYLISQELKNAINYGPANVDIIPHLKREESSTNSFVFSDLDKDS